MNTYYIGILIFPFHILGEAHCVNMYPDQQNDWVELTYAWDKNLWASAKVAS